MNVAHKINSVGLVCKPRDSKIWAQVKIINDYLIGLGIKTFILGSFKNRDNLFSCNGYTMGQSCDLIVSIGGDGTLLFAAREFSKFDIPIVGINYGLVGQLNEIQPKNAQTDLHKILKGDYFISSHSLIKHNVKPAPGARVGKISVNDIVIRGAKGISMIEVNVINSERNFSFRADGLIVSTPIGSSSYSQSAGGPVLARNLEAVVISPICAHLERVSSYVCKNNEKITIKINSTKSRASEIYCDGQFCVQMKNPTSVTIKKTKHKLRMVHLLKS